VGTVKTPKLRYMIGMIIKVRLVRQNKDQLLKEGKNQINCTCDMFSYIYSLSHICSRIMNILNEIAVSVQKVFLVQGHLAFGMI
jgi:hypothetical protein